VSRASHHPLLRWRVRNFKSIATADLELAPLTVLVGANSTGKSSLLQSMLLAAQSAGAPPGEPGIPLNGALVELGELAELRRAGAGAREAVALGCTVAGGGSRPDDGRELEWDVELAAGPRGEGSGLARVRRVASPALSMRAAASSWWPTGDSAGPRAGAGAGGRPTGRRSSGGAVAPQRRGRKRQSASVWCFAAGSGVAAGPLGPPRGCSRPVGGRCARPSAIAAGRRCRGGRGRAGTRELARAAAGRLVSLVAAAIGGARARARGAEIAAVFSAFEAAPGRGAQAGRPRRPRAGRTRGRWRPLGPGGAAAAIDDPTPRSWRAASRPRGGGGGCCHAPAPPRSAAQDPQLLYRSAPSGSPASSAPGGVRGRAPIARRRSSAPALPTLGADGGARRGGHVWLRPRLAASIDTSDAPARPRGAPHHARAARDRDDRGRRRSARRCRCS
jgi:hypothetical protein